MATRNRPSTSRIGIIGGGPAGLTAAHYLTRCGYPKVTVLERENRVGGKCCSVRQGQHVYEMGAVLATRDYTTTRELMDSVGIDGAPTDGVNCFDLEGHPIDLFPRRQIPRLLWQVLVHYAWATQVRYRQINGPGLAGVDPDLCEPFQEFAEHHGLPSLQGALAPPFTAFGYGYFSEVPTAYVMKYLDLHMIESLRSPSRRLVWPEGVETLWSRIAEQHDVRTGVTVRHVTRSDTVRVETEQDVLEFDDLILTSPLDDALGYLDASPTERRLFSAIRTYDYWVLLCRIDGLPDSSGFLPAHFLSEARGHLMMWYHRWHDEPLYTLYALGDGSMTEDDIERTCAADLQHLGAWLDEVVDARCWKYFPHVTSSVMADGFYDDLEELQGTRHTYYAGELMSFSTIERSASYSRDLVDRFFAPQDA